MDYHMVKIPYANFDRFWLINPCMWRTDRRTDRR